MGGYVTLHGKHGARTIPVGRRTWEALQRLAEGKEPKTASSRSQRAHLADPTSAAKVAGLKNKLSLLADREAMRRWFRPSIFEPRPGGRVEFVFPSTAEDSISRGEITAYDPPSRVAYTWAWQSSPESNTEVTFELVDEGDSTLVRLTHVGFVDEQQARRHEAGWDYWMGRLRTAATGADPGPDNHAAAESRRAALAALLREEIALKRSR